MQGKFKQLGWKRIVIWECLTGNLKNLERLLREAMLSVQVQDTSPDKEAFLSYQMVPDSQCQINTSPSSACFAGLAGLIAASDEQDLGQS
jgi:hypothetical protein